jgi:mono/diheme cytochrome c family protein
MLTRTLGAFIAVSAIVLTSFDASANSLGEYEYRNSCVQCHGASGKGDGWLGGFLNKAPSDLTVLQKNNGGVFPVERVYKIIEGSEDVLVHGPREMPVWGDRFRARPQNDEDAGFATDEDVREYARTRILALIQHLSTIQAE